MAEIISFANLKGGSGKTSTAVNVAYSLMRMGSKVLLIDCDPQGNATMTLGTKPVLEIEDTIGDVFSDGKRFSELAQPSKYKGIDLVASNLDVVGALTNLPPNSIRRSFGFKNAYEEDNLENSYDYVLLDCPPSIDGAPLVNSLILSNFVVIPVDGAYALAAVRTLIDSIMTIRKEARSSLAVLGILMTQQDGRTNESRALRDSAITLFGNAAIFDAHVPRNAAIKESQISGKALCDHNRKSPGCIAYNKVTSEILQRIASYKKS